MLVALHRGKGFIARAIQWQSRSVYSHASVMICEHSQRVIESREFHGVRMLNWFASPPVEPVDLFRADITESEERSIRGFLLDQVGKPYDYCSVARFISRRKASKRDAGRWFCSELVAAAFAAAEVPLLARVEPWAVSPGLLALSPLLEPTRLNS